MLEQWVPAGIAGSFAIGHLSTIAHLHRLDLRKGCCIRPNLDEKSKSEKD